MKVNFVRAKQNIFPTQFKNLWENIVDLSIYTRKITWTNMNKLLNLTENLKYLSLDRFYYFIFADNFNDLNMNTLPRLKLDSLTISYCNDDSPLKLLQHCSVKKLEISYNYSSENKSECFKIFIKRKTELEHLILSFLNLNEFANVFYEDLINANFSLK